MVTNHPNAPTEDFFASAAELLLKSSVSIAEQCRQDLPALFPPESDSSPLVHEYLACLGSIALHEAHAKQRLPTPVDINQTCHALKDSLARVTHLDASLQRHAQLFDEQTFHDLLAHYFNGKLSGFGFTAHEVQDVTVLTGLAAPQSPGIETLFFALLVRLFRLADLKQIADANQRQKTALQLTQHTETGIASFGLALQLLK